MNTEKLRSALLEYLEANPVTRHALPPAAVLLLLYPIMQFCSLLFEDFSFAPISGLLYFLFLFGIVLCFAKNERLLLLIGLGLAALQRLVSLFSYFSFNQLVYLLVYALLCYLAFKWFSQTKNYDELRQEVKTVAERVKPSVERAAAPVNADKFCAVCGTAMLNDEIYCLKCGSKWEVPAPAAAMTAPPQEAVSIPTPEAPPVPVADPLTEELPPDDMVYYAEQAAEEEQPTVSVAPAAEEEDAPLFCMHCGAKLMDGAAFCMKCGRSQ